MIPDDFLSLAVKLSNSSGEAEKRSAVSRAYYGLFHCARLLLEDCGVPMPETAEAHVKIGWCLQRCLNESVADAGGKLSTYRTTRNDADYKLSDKRFADGKFIQVQIGIAKRIFTSLQSAAGDMATIRPAVRKYAKDDLKMIVRGDD